MPDADVRGNIGVVHTAFLPPRSLQIDERVMMECVMGSVECCAIRDSWRPFLPIVVLTAEVDNLTNENRVDPSGSLADLPEAA
jgi:hypothetical protein